MNRIPAAAVGMAAVLILGTGGAGPAAAQAPVDTALRLRLNLPAYRLEAIQGEQVVMTVRVAIGMRDYQTPTGGFSVSTITWNPWWFPPPSPWAAGDTITPPCSSNPVGRVKLGFAPLHFIHGTPAPRSIGRAASHGCVRATQQDALALAALVIRHVLPESTAAAERHAADTATRAMRLAHPVPLEIRYDLAELRGDSLWLYPDVYRRTPSRAARLRDAVRLLGAAGRDTTALDRTALAAAIARSRLAPVALPAPGKRPGRS